jgi:hypothetical protein
MIVKEIDQFHRQQEDEAVAAAAGGGGSSGGVATGYSGGGGGDDQPPLPGASDDGGWSPGGDDGGLGDVSSTPQPLSAKHAGVPGDGEGGGGGGGFDAYDDNFMSVSPAVAQAAGVLLPEANHNLRHMVAATDSTKRPRKEDSFR